MHMIRLSSPLAGPIGWVAAILFMWTGLGACVHAAVPDALLRPSLQSARAASRTMLAIVRAGKRLVAVGERGIVLLSDDNGKAWRQAKVPVSVTLTAVHFATAAKGWAVGHSGVILHSADGGETWIKQLDGVEAAKLMLISAKKNAGDVSRSTEEKDVAYAEQLVGDGPDKPFLDVYFIDEMRGFVVGTFGLAFSTVDGGKHWQDWSRQIPNPKGKHLYRFASRGAELWIAGEQGALFRSGDRGMSFEEIRTPYSGTYFGVIAGTGGNLVAFGLRGNAYHSMDNGRNWSKIDNSVEATLTDGLRLSDGSLILVDQVGRVLRSIDQGLSFLQLPLSQSLPLTGVGQAADGSLVLASFRGLILIPAVKLVGTK